MQNNTESAALAGTVHAFFACRPRGTPRRSARHRPGCRHVRGPDHNVRDESGIAQITRCIHQNPARRGLVPVPADWPWSSDRWHFDERNGALPMDDPRGFRLSESRRLVERHGSLAEVARSMKERLGVL